MGAEPMGVTLDLLRGTILQIAPSSPAARAFVAAPLLGKARTAGAAEFTHDGSDAVR
jgi:hypothetical protein